MTDEDFRAEIIAALRAIGGGQLSGPSGIEGLAMAIGGEQFVDRRESLAKAVYAVASALDRIADHLEHAK